MMADDVLSALRPHVENGTVPGLVVGVDDAGGRSVAAAGTTTPGGGPALGADDVVRISSNTKPLVGALALLLVRDGLLAPDEPVDRLVPELAARRVVRTVDAEPDDTVPAERAITVDDLLTMRMGFGWVWDSDSPVLDAALDSGVGLGPPDPAGLPDEATWLARFAAFPLLHQPGAAWRYDLAFLVLGIALSRAAGRPLPELLHERLLAPLGMASTAFVGEPVPQWRVDDGGLAPFDAGGAGSRWAAPPALPDARGGLVSTAADLLRFARALLDGGGGVLTPDEVATLTTDHLTGAQRADPTAAPFLYGGGWGYGVGIGSGPAGRRYGWAGGLGTLWWSWPEHDTAAVLLTQVTPPAGPLFTAFQAHIETALAS